VSDRRPENDRWCNSLDSGHVVGCSVNCTVVVVGMRVEARSTLVMLLIGFAAVRAVETNRRGGGR